MFFDVNLSRVGFEIQVANTSEEALQLASSATPSAIIAELDLKPQDGIDMCWMMRQTKYLQVVPLILLADKKMNDELVLRAFRNGVDAILEWPTSLRTLIGRIEALIWRFNHLVQPQNESENRETDDFSPDEQPSIEANLKSFSLLEMLQFLNMNKKSGTLIVQKEQIIGTLVLTDGEVKFAETEGHLGEEAAYRLAIWQEGRLKFYPKPKDFTANIEKPTMKLILDCCTVLDMENFMVNP